MAFFLQTGLGAGVKGSGQCHQLFCCLCCWYKRGKGIAIFFGNKAGGDITCPKIGIIQNSR